MDEPMPDSCADPVKDDTGEPQYVSVEIDTQATDGYDNALFDDAWSKEISDISLRPSLVSNQEPRYMVPLDQDEPVLDFKFAKPAHTTPIFRPAKPCDDATTAPLRRDLNHTSEICSGAQEESHRENRTNEHFTAGVPNTASKAGIENNEMELAAEVGASQRPALRQKDSNIQLSTNIPARQQKRGVSFATCPINNDQQPIQKLRPQQTRQPRPMPPPFLDVQSQTNKKRGTTTARIPHQQPLISSQKECPTSPPREPYSQKLSTTQPGLIPSEIEEQTPGHIGVLQQKEAVSMYADVENDLNVGHGHISERQAAAPRHGTPFEPPSEMRAHSPATTSDGKYDQLRSRKVPKSVISQTSRASISSKLIGWVSKVPDKKMPFPEATCPASPQPNNGQRMHEIGRPMFGAKPGQKGHSRGASPSVNLQSNAQTSPRWSREVGHSNNLPDSHGSITQPQDDDLSDDLHQIIHTRVEKVRRKISEEMSEQIREKDAKINEVSKKNEYYEDNIHKLTKINTLLSEQFAAMGGQADALNELLHLQLDGHRSFKDSVTECKHEAEDLKVSLMEANRRLEGLQLYHQNSKVKLEETKALAITQIESSKSLKGHLDRRTAELQQERHESALLRKELQALHGDKRLKDAIKDLLDGLCLSVTERLNIQENKLSEAISNADRETQNRLSDCLRFLESTGGEPPQSPKELLEMMGLIETLTTSIGDRFQSADDGSEALRNAGTEVMEALKSRVETLFEMHDTKNELEERISSLQVANARLEAAARGHEERIPELQTQLAAKESELDRYRAESNVKFERNRSRLDDMKKELEQCREELATKDDELRQAESKIEAGSIAQQELAILQATQAKSASELADATKQFRDCQVALSEQSEITSVMQVRNTDLEERLSSAEQKAGDIEREMSRFKATASEDLKRQRIEAETDRRKSLESEKRSHVQKVSNLQRLRVEAEAMVEGLKEESKKLKEDVESKELMILALQAEKTTLEDTREKQSERLAQLEHGSISQAVEYHSLTEALKSAASDISQLKTGLRENEEEAAIKNRLFNEFNENIEVVIHQYIAVMSRLESYERIEAKFQDYCWQSGIPFEVSAMDAILEIIAAFEIRNGGVANKTTASHDSGTQTTPFTPKVVRLQDPKSPEILDSQAPCAPSSSPLPRRGVRSIVPQRSAIFANAPLFARGSSEEITSKFTTRTTPVREHAPRVPLFNSPEVEDSQDRRDVFTRSPSYSPLSVLNSSEVDEADDCYILPSDCAGNKEGQREETPSGRYPTTTPTKAGAKPSKAQVDKPGPKLIAKKPLKSCLKQTMPRHNLMDDEATLSSDIAKTPLSDPTSMKPPTGRPPSKARLATLSGVHDQSKKLPYNIRTRSGSTPRSESKQSITPVQSESSVSQLNFRKRSMSLLSSGVTSEPPTKQARLSLPGREFQAVSPFVPEAIRKGEGSVV
ncbi:hypothetical protein V490_05644 [Pseudogymnoascus sp. VKM F-3557]|nr:hypothetical protein V490_05644 [Pseudogymnoascus sp. VKM F-3557]